MDTKNNYEKTPTILFYIFSVTFNTILFYNPTVILVHNFALLYILLIHMYLQWFKMVDLDLSSKSLLTLAQEATKTETEEHYILV